MSEQEPHWHVVTDPRGGNRLQTNDGVYAGAQLSETAAAVLCHTANLLAQLIGATTELAEDETVEGNTDAYELAQGLDHMAEDLYRTLLKTYEEADPDE